MRRHCSRKSMSELADCVITALNSVLEADPEAVIRLIESRVPCDPKVLRDHVFAVPLEGPDESLTLGPLGLINGILACMGIQERVQAVYNVDQSSIREFVSVWSPPPGKEIVGRCPGFVYADGTTSCPRCGGK